MNIIEVFKMFKSQEDSIKYLEKVRWNNKPVCPYCKCESATKKSGEFRYQCCNSKCNNAFSVTVGTIYHHTHLPLQKWLLATCMITNAKKGISSLQLSRDLDINQKTAWRMQMKIREAMQDKDQLELMKGIVEVDECYIGGKKKKGDKKKDDDDNDINKRGRGTDKQGVIGVVNRETGEVRAETQDKFTFNDLKAFVSKYVDFNNSTLYSDDFSGYKPFKKIVEHAIVSHSRGQYVNGDIHTNTIEGFWGLFKRSIVGSYHKLSAKYLNQYIQECCFKYNNRNNNDMFGMLVRNGVC
jgi:transposase-like protein